MHTSAAHAMLALSARAPPTSEPSVPHPVRKVAHLLCDDPAPSSPAPTSNLSAAATSKRPRGGPACARGARGRFVERPVPRAGAAASAAARGPAKAVAKAVRPYKKYYANATPSAHCHVCARTAKAVRFAVCARLRHGLCRKVICDKCFVKFGWDWHAALADRDWICVHCRGDCPEERSQCYIYSRVNRRRETKRARRSRVASASVPASASAPPAQLPAAAPNASAVREPAVPALPSLPAVLSPRDVLRTMAPAPLEEMPDSAYAQLATLPQRPSPLFSPLSSYDSPRVEDVPRPMLPFHPAPLPPVRLVQSAAVYGRGVAAGETGGVRYGSRSPGSDVTAKTNEAELRLVATAPLSLRR